MRYCLLSIIIFAMQICFAQDEKCPPVTSAFGQHRMILRQINVRQIYSLLGEQYIYMNIDAAGINAVPFGSEEQDSVANANMNCSYWKNYRLLRIIYRMSEFMDSYTNKADANYLTQLQGYRQEFMKELAVKVNRN